MATTNAQRLQFLIAHEEGFKRSRLPALYADFRGMRTTNPEGYAANVAVWRRALTSLVRRGMLPCSSSASTPSRARASPSAATTTTATNLLILSAGQPLLDALHSDRYGSPDALDAVLREAVEARDLAPLSAFLSASESINGRSSSWTAWAAGIPWSVLSWGVGQLGVGGLFGGGGAQKFVVLANVEEAASAFVARTADLRSRFDRTWSVAHFKREFGQPGAVLDGSPEKTDGPALRLSDADLDVLLVFLSRDKGIVAYDGRVVTLRGGEGRRDRAGDVITDEDVAVAQLRELIERQTHQTQALGRRVDELAVEARDALVLRKNRVAAMAALRLKKQAEADLTARYGVLAQLEATAARIEQAADNVQLVQAMSAGADVLRALNEQVGGVAGVEEVLCTLHDNAAESEEISQALVQDAYIEVEEELEAMERQEQAKADELVLQEKQQKQEAESRAADEVRLRLAAVEQVPDKLDVEAETAETTESLRELTLNEPLKS